MKSAARSAILLGVLAGLLPSPSARAQGGSQQGEFSVQRFEPALGPRNYLAVAGGRTEGDWAWSTELLFAYARDPFVLRSCASGGDCSSSDGASSQDVHVVRGVALDVAAPLGHATAEGSYVGNSSPLAAGLRGIFDAKLGRLLLAANVGAVLREAATMGSATVGPELRYGAAAGVRAVPSLVLFAGALGAAGFSGKSGSVPLEVLGAVQFAPGDIGLVLTAGGGTGVIRGVGVPLARAVAGVGYVGLNTDPDGDGVAGSLDRCPSEAEDRDGVQDADGCPEVDADGDGIPDEADQCPEQAETANGYQDGDGCPDAFGDADGDHVPDDQDKCPKQAGTAWTKEFYGCPDKDKDGVADQVDKCPNLAEDQDNFEDADGCPDLDHDHDGVADSFDECPNEPEVVNGFKDDDGCPDEAPDADGDGIPDEKDRCPRQPEILNGVSDGDGCPDAGPKLAEVSTDSVALVRPLAFAREQITDPPSLKALDALAAGLVNHPEIFLVQVTVTTTPADAALAPKRAQAVVAVLVSRGVAKTRLQAKGASGDSPGTSFTVLLSTRKAIRF
ncbi:MAG: thrombospondin type 3 repeat-containing protein [Deltaproteobacteria bacterium]|nr:thrombospondin type 3 repeat-containing protein [Deltaproteobacteria bacterium]